MPDHNILILGAGVIGLTTAHLLSRDNPSYTITILARDMPGDYTPYYASPWAGANYDTYAPLGSRANTLEKETWPYLKDLAANHPDAAVHFQDTKCVMRTKDRGKASYRKYEESEGNYPWLRHWRVEREECGEGVDGVVGFESVCVNTAVYLPWLVGRCAEKGVVFRRGVVGHLAEVEEMGVMGGRVDVVVNCTGLGARKLGGVMDEKVNPVRGQTVIVREENDAMYSVSGTDGPEGDRDYQMMRAAGGGTVLGGCAQEGSWDGEVDMDLAERIMKRAVEACPALVKDKTTEGPEGLSVIKHGVGLRPAREGGARIERENIQGLEVVHCYGHGGAGYQQSYGSAKEVVGLVEQILQ